MIFYSKLEKGKIKVDKGLHKYFMTMLCLPIRIKETIYKQKTINSPSPLWVTLLNACHRYLLVHCFVLTHTKKKSPNPKSSLVPSIAPPKGATGADMTRTLKEDDKQ